MIVRSIISVVCIYGLITGACFARNRQIDSLFLVLKNAKEDTGKVNTLKELSEALLDNFKYDSAMQYADKALSLSEKLNFSKGKALAYSSIGRIIYAGQINYTDALKNYLLALEIYENLNDKAGIARSYIHIGSAYYRQDNDPEALKCFYKALKLFEDMNDQKFIGMSLSWIANTYYYLENYAESEKYHLAAIKVMEKSGDTSGIAYSNKVLAMLYIMQADTHYATGDKITAEQKYAEALKNLRASVKVYETAMDKKGLLDTYSFLSRLYQSRAANALKENDRQLSEEYFSRALQVSLNAVKMAEEIRDKNYISEYCNDLGVIYTRLNNYPVARKYLERALRLSKEIRFKSNVMDSYNNLVRLDSSESNFKQAYEHYKQFITYRDSLINEQRTKESVQAKMQYEFGKKEDSLKQQHLVTETKLSAQTKQRYFYWGGLVMLAALSFFVFLNFRNQKKINRLADDAHAKQKAELELQSLRAQLNPHFMFNSLNAIQELILMEENEKSQSYLARFAKLLRMLLENADRPFIPLQREIDFLQLYLSLENLRIPDLRYSIIVDTQIDTEQTLIPNMILQPYIENAIWHGLSHKKNDRKLQLRILSINGTVRYEIEDNGVGRKKSAELKSLFRKEHRSKGMELLSKRFKLLAKEYGSDIETVIDDVMSNDGIDGTLVTITVPVEISEEMQKTEKTRMKLKAILLILVNAVFGIGSAFSQTIEISDLRLLLANAKKEDTAKVNILNELSYSLYMNFDYDSSLAYARKALTLAREIKYPRGEGFALVNVSCYYGDRYVLYGQEIDFNKSNMYIDSASVIAGKIADKKLTGFTYHAYAAQDLHRNNLKGAYEKYHKALELYKQTGDKKLTALVMRVIAQMNLQQSNYPESLKHAYKALKYFEETRDEIKIAESFALIATVNIQYGKYPDAIDSYNECVAIYKRHNKKFDVAEQYTNMADTYLLLKEPGNAIEKYTIAMKIFTDPEAPSWGVPWCYSGIGKAYELRGDSAKAAGSLHTAKKYYLEAEHYCIESVNINVSPDDRNDLTRTYVFLGDINIKLENFLKAENWFQKALSLNEEMQIKNIFRDAYLGLSKIYESTGPAKKAFEHFKAYILYRDTISNEEGIRKAEGYKLQYEFDKKEDSLKQKQIITETKLETQHKQKYFYWAGLAMLALLSFFVFLTFRNQKKINRLAGDAHAKEKAELELQSLRAQLNPHFMFNSLNAIQELILLEENEKSQSYLARFAKLLRILLENAEKPFIPLQKEIDFLHLYLSLENLRIPDLRYSIMADPQIDTEQTLIPNMILQPYIENAIWHGLSHKQGDRQLELRIGKTNGIVQYEIEDNGVGRKKAAELKSLYRKEHKSKGMELLSKRFKLLAKEFGSDIETVITDVTDNESIKGTLVTIKVPNAFSGKDKPQII